MQTYCDNTKKCMQLRKKQTPALSLDLSSQTDIDVPLSNIIFFLSFTFDLTLNLKYQLFQNILK